ncbi:MAG: SMC-Scp complex subunit ScpB [Anaerolineales bacterium]
MPSAHSTPMTDDNRTTSLPPDSENSLALESQIEALLFVADGPTPIGQLAAALDVSAARVRTALAVLDATLQQRGIRLQYHHEQVQITTAPEMAPAIETFLGLESTQRLTQSALETLALVAYQQPVTRPQIDAVRGVNSDSVIKRLHSRGLIEEVGRASGPGRPILYGTTPEFMQHFGLSSLSELPPLENGDESAVDEPT